MSQGTDDILHEVAGIVEKSGSAGDAVDELRAVHLNNTDKFGEVVNQSETVGENIESINKMFRDVINEAEVVESIGKEKIDQFEYFSSRMKGLNKAGGLQVLPDRVCRAATGFCS